MIMALQLLSRLEHICLNPVMYHDKLDSGVAR
jgi:hypothetical protein